MIFNSNIPIDSREELFCYIDSLLFSEEEIFFHSDSHFFLR